MYDSNLQTTAVDADQSTTSLDDAVNKSSPTPLVIDPAKLDSVNIQLERNQQCVCGYCGKAFNSVWYLRQHAVKHSNIRPFQCQFCKKTYKFRSNLYQHKCPDRLKAGNVSRFNTINDDITPFLPEDNSEYFDMFTQSSFGYSINQEMENERESVERTEDPQEENVQALSIKERFGEETIKRYLEANMHKLHFCRSCHEYFPTRGYLMRHMTKHAVEDAFVHRCELCPERFLTAEELRRHSFNHSSSSEQSFACHSCSASFRSVELMYMHREQCCEFGTSSTTKSATSTSLDEYRFIDESDILDFIKNELPSTNATVSNELSEDQQLKTAFNDLSLIADVNEDNERGNVLEECLSMHDSDSIKSKSEKKRARGRWKRDMDNTSSCMQYIVGGQSDCDSSSGSESKRRTPIAQDVMSGPYGNCTAIHSINPTQQQVGFDALIEALSRNLYNNLSITNKSQNEEAESTVEICDRKFDENLLVLLSNERRLLADMAYAYETDDCDTTDGNGED